MSTSIPTEALFKLIREEQTRLLTLQRDPKTVSRDNAVALQTLDWVLQLPDTQRSNTERVSYFARDFNSL